MRVSIVFIWIFGVMYIGAINIPITSLIKFNILITLSLKLYQYTIVIAIDETLLAYVEIKFGGNLF